MYVSAICLEHMEIEAHTISSKYLRNSILKDQTMNLSNVIYNLKFNRWILRLSIRFATEMQMFRI